MSYKIFISHTESDKRIAEVVKNTIKKAFNGDVIPILAHQEIKAGDNWKSEIKKHLSECSAIISIITKNSINKPWIFIEWSVYWMANKKFYVLLYDDVKFTDLVQPMQDTQFTSMTDASSVKKLFSRLSDDSGCDDVPFEKVDDLVDSVKLAYFKQETDLKEKSYFKYKNNLEVLPNDDGEVEKIALFFYEQKEEDIFKRISSEIKSDSIKNNLALRMLRDNKNEYAFHIAKNIKSAQIQAAIVISLLDNGLDDSKYVRGLLDEISQKSSSHLKEICIHLVEQGNEDSDIFRNIINLMSSMAELRKIAVYFVENNKDETDVFLDIIEKLSSNGSELRKVGILLIQSGRQKSDPFKKIFDRLSKSHQGKLLDEQNRL